MFGVRTLSLCRNNILFLFLYFECYFCTSERSSKSYPVTVVLLQSVIAENRSSMAEEVKNCKKLIIDVQRELKNADLLNKS